MTDAEVEIDELWQSDFVPALAEPELRWTPEQCMLLAMIEGALADLADRNERVRADALAWLLEDAPEPTALSFRVACDHLAIEPSSVRARLGQLAGGASARRRGTLAAWRTPGARRGAGGTALRGAVANDHGTGGGMARAA